MIYRIGGGGAWQNLASSWDVFSTESPALTSVLSTSPPHQHKLSEFIIYVEISLEDEGIYSPWHW